jgi:GR25 family glycosyltransferase involved in LPS biosynthesis
MVLARFVIDLGLLLGPGWKNMERRIYAEMALSKKHIKALEALSMSERDSLLTVEDDIHFSVESKLDLATVSSTLKRLGKASAFLSLSVAFTTSQLGILKITKKWGDGFMEVEGGIANSTAAYLVTQDFAKQALELLKSTPRLSWLPADWLLTELQSRIPKHVCLDAVAGPFVNGSLFGLDSSEIRP